ncbi:MAG: CDP-glycerol glycerophosphotransferase family protein, partial [Chloroflexi bacterium]|nr:CDP-glycerol glycerophosphotransferase family protein [Chloroflexota bacterium]
MSMMAMFNLSPSKVWITGLPRNDWLVQDGRDLPPDLYDLELRLKSLIGGRRLVVYASTFRNDRSGLYHFTADEIEDLAALLREKNAVLGIRSHINRQDRPAFANRPEFLDL